MSDHVYTLISRYTQPALIVFGTIGALLNQILFYKRKSLRATSCSLYFRALSINDLLVLYVYVLAQWLVDQYGFDPMRNNDWYCKLKSYLNSGLYTTSPYLVVLACFDRLCTSSTNARLRRLASIRVASYLIPCTVLLVFVAYWHTPVWYQSIVTPTFAVCTVINPTYNRIIPMFLIIILGVLPPFLMLIFCSVTLYFLRLQRRRVMPVNFLRLRQRDNQLIKMLFIYVLSHSICTIPFTVTLALLVYHFGTSSSIVITLFRCFILLFNVNFATSFYIYTLGTPFYRREFYRLMQSIRKRFLQLIGKHQNHAHPLRAEPFYP
jgi:hypothetical protein